MCLDTKFAQLPVIRVVIVELLQKDGINIVVDPVYETRHVGIDAGNSVLSAADAPGHDACLDVAVAPAETHEGRASISCAGVNARGAACAHEGWVEFEKLTEPGCAKGFLAEVGINGGKFNLLEDVLEHSFLPEPIFAPASGPAVGVIECLSLFRKADGVHVGCEFHGGVEEQESEIVEKVCRVKFAVGDDVADVAILVRVEFISFLGVPFSYTDVEDGWVDVIDAVGGREYDLRVDEGTAANVVLFLHVVRRVLSL